VCIQYMVGDALIIRRQWAMPSKNTFEIKPIKELIHRYYKSNETWLNPFANTNTYGITNDLDTQYSTDYHLDALDFLQLYKDKVQKNEDVIHGVLYDPPFSPRQVSECYKRLGKTVNMQTTQASYWSNHKKLISDIVQKDGIVITCGWNSGGIGKKYGFEIVEVLLVPHGGWHNDTIVTVEKKL
jgi:hypothetical protein